MAALKIGRNIISVECNAIHFIHSKLRVVSELEDNKHEEENDKQEDDDR